MPPEMWFIGLTLLILAIGLWQWYRIRQHAEYLTCKDSSTSPQTLPPQQRWTKQI